MRFTRNTLPSSDLISKMPNPPSFKPGTKKISEQKKTQKIEPNPIKQLQPQEYQQISSKQLNEIINSKNPCFIFEIRPKLEYLKVHINHPNSINFDSTEKSLNLTSKWQTTLAKINDYSKHVIIVAGNENNSSIILSNLDSILFKNFHSMITSFTQFKNLALLRDPFERFRDLYPLACSMDDFQPDHKNSSYKPIEFTDGNYQFSSSRFVKPDITKPKSFENLKNRSNSNRFGFNSTFPNTMNENELHSVGINIKNEQNLDMVQNFENSDYADLSEAQTNQLVLYKGTDKEEQIQNNFSNEELPICPQISPQKPFECTNDNGMSSSQINTLSSPNQNIYSTLPHSTNYFERNYPHEESDYCDMTDSIFDKKAIPSLNDQTTTTRDESYYNSDRNVYANINMPISPKHLSSDYNLKSADESTMQLSNEFPMSSLKKSTTGSLIELGVFQQNENLISNNTNSDTLILPLQTIDSSGAISTDRQFGPSFEKYDSSSSLSIRDETYFDRSTKPELEERPTRLYTGYRRDSPPFRREIDQPFVVGLQNGSMICYMNSVIQSLVSVGEFRNWLEKAYNTFYEFLPDDSFVRTLYWYQTEIVLGKYNFLSTSKLENIVFKMITHFTRGQQQDAHEFLILLISCLEDEIQLIQKECASNSLTENYSAFAECLEEFEKLFYGNIIRVYSCNHCGATSSSNEKFNHITVPLSKDNDDLRDGEEIDSCLMRFFAPESITFSYEWKCDHCVCVREATKTQLVDRLPNLLILHLSRYSNTGRKIQSFIQYPINKLQYSFPFFRESENKIIIPPEYALLSVINHHGLSLTSGHYTASCRRPVPDPANTSWFTYDDRRVDPIGTSSDLIVSSSGYLLFYSSLRSPTF